MLCLLFNNNQERFVLELFLKITIELPSNNNSNKNILASLRINIVAAIFILIINSSCEGNNKQEKNAEKDSASSNINSQPQSPTFDSTEIASFIERYTQLSPLQQVLDSFYHKRNYAFAWFSDKGIKPVAADLYNHVVNITSEGLPDNMPYKTEFRDLMKNQAAESLHNEPVFTE